ncbi:hypothetical protein C5U62_24370 [Pseudomonas protegens]|uniref:Uncharacterized protein n=1 Tax=Pseudomonas protegens TaxID=380021 RepID=A0A2T6GED1_9PSED|nr:hypothetical protein C5U62_24370 [Pseudomonas protegens]
MANAKTPQPLDPHELVKWLTALRRALQATGNSAPLQEPAGAGLGLPAKASISFAPGLRASSPASTTPPGRRLRLLPAQ